MTKNLRRAEAAEHLRSTHNIPCTSKTLANYASQGGGPSMRFWGRIPIYTIEDLDTWVGEKLGDPVANSAQRRNVAQ